MKQQHIGGLYRRCTVLNRKRCDQRLRGVSPVACPNGSWGRLDGMQVSDILQRRTFMNELRLGIARRRR